MSRLRPLLLRFVKFGGLSGLGWIADSCILLVLVHSGVRPLLANVTSSSIAALSVFLLSRETVFRKASGGLLLRAGLYLSYTALMICAASVCLAVLAGAITHLAVEVGWQVSPLAAAFAAKIAVTPPQLLLNFVMSQFLSERELRRRSGALG